MTSNHSIHRTGASRSIRYRTALARRLRAENGNILVLHGTSSLGDRVAAVGRDGIVKVQFYTGAARAAGAALRNAGRRNRLPCRSQRRRAASSTPPGAKLFAAKCWRC